MSPDRWGVSPGAVISSVATSFVLARDGVDCGCVRAFSPCCPPGKGLPDGERSPRVRLRIQWIDRAARPGGDTDRCCRETIRKAGRRFRRNADWSRMRFWRILHDRRHGDFRVRHTGITPPDSAGSGCRSSRRAAGPVPIGSRSCPAWLTGLACVQYAERAAAGELRPFMISCPDADPTDPSTSLGIGTRDGSRADRSWMGPCVCRSHVVKKS